MWRHLIIAIALAIPTGASLWAQASRRAEVQFKAAEYKEQVEGDLKGAIKEYEKVVKGQDRALAAQALLRIADVQVKLGEAEAQKTYERLIRDFKDQAGAVSIARAKLDAGRRSPSAMIDRHLWTTTIVPSQLGRPSSDGRYLPYSANERQDLMIHEIATGRDRLVTRLPSGRIGNSIIFSSDGSRLAFTFRNDSGHEIRSIMTDGSDLRTVHVVPEPAFWAYVLDFSPDGTRILCSKGTAPLGGDSLFWVNVANGAIQNVAQKGAWSRLSPDGRYVAVRNAPGPNGLSLLAADGTAEIVLSKNSDDKNPVGWTRDGRVLFLRARREGTDLWAAPVVDGRPAGPALLVQRNFDIANELGMQVTRDGSLYYAKSSDSGSGVYTASVDLSSGRLLDAPVPEFSGGGGLPNGEVSASWSHDGRYLAYAPDYSSGLMVRTVETGETRSIQGGLTSFRLFSWSPDGSKFAAGGGDGDRGGIFWVDSKDGMKVEPIVLATRGVFNRNPRLSKDGGKLYYVRVPLSKAGTFAVLERDVTSGVERVLVDNTRVRDNHFHRLVPSPDGRFAAYTLDDPDSKQDKVVYLHPLDGGEPRGVLRIPAAQALHCSVTDWTPDSRAILYHCSLPGGSGAGENFVLPLSDLKPRKIELGYPTAVVTSVHPDGQRLAFFAGSGQSRTELHVLENLLPATGGR